MATITFHEIPHDSPAWSEVLTHRDRILRRPLGLSLSPEDTTGEESQRHFILRVDDQIIAGLIACPPKEGTIKLRQMWVHEDHERSGLGSRLLGETADLLSQEGISTLTLHARLSVRGFYEKCGYQAIDEIFTEIGIPHIAMTRQLNPPTQPKTSGSKSFADHESLN